MVAVVPSSPRRRLPRLQRRARPRPLAHQEREPRQQPDLVRTTRRHDHLDAGDDAAARAATRRPEPRRHHRAPWPRVRGLRQTRRHRAAEGMEAMMAERMHEYELKTDTGKVIRWPGRDEEDAARR